MGITAEHKTECDSNPAGASVLPTLGIGADGLPHLDEDMVRAADKTCL